MRFGSKCPYHGKGKPASHTYSFKDDDEQPLWKEEGVSNIMSVVYSTNLSRIGTTYRKSHATASDWNGVWISQPRGKVRTDLSPPATQPPTTYECEHRCGFVDTSFANVQRHEGGCEFVVDTQANADRIKDLTRIFRENGDNRGGIGQLARRRMG